MQEVSKALAAAALVVLVSSPSVAQQPSVQQQFEAASASLKAEKWADALATFEALEKRLSRSPRNVGIVRVRKAEALIKLGRQEEAEAALKNGLPVLPENDPSLREDRMLGLLSLARIHELALDYSEALRLYRMAEPLTVEPAFKVQALRGLIRTGMFYDGEAALAEADRALGLIAVQPGDNKSAYSQFRILKGRTLLNLGRFQEARVELRAAVGELGGLTLKVDAADIAARSDLAIAALLAGDQEDARRYLAYTGAGRMPDGAFATGADMPMPSCDEADDLRPDDVAVIEFSIGEDGSVKNAAPIYASRPGNGALSFARAVSYWSWTPEKMKKIPPLLRLLTRVEMRCVTGSKRPSISDMLVPEAEKWLSDKGIAPSRTPDIADAQRVKPLADELAEREARYGTQSLQLVPILSALADNKVVSRELASGYGRQALDIVKAEKSPPIIVAYFGILAARAQGPLRGGHWTLPDFSPLLADATVMADPRAAAALRLTDADYRYRAGKQRQVISLLTQVRDTPGLAPTDPMRAAALMRLASLQLSNGHAEEAQATFQQSGLASDQCALLDTKPRLKSNAAAYGGFPEEAMRWGFEGWTQLEHDIRADGLPANVRVLIAYPPFVFSKAATTITQHARFEKTFRPDGGLGCGGQIQRVVFSLP